MALEIRPYRPEESAAFRRVPSVVFGNYRGWPPDEEPADGLRIPPEWSMCAFEDGTLATTYGAYPMVMQLNGQKAPAAGVTIVGTLPWFRRRGHLRKIMEVDLKRRYEQRLEPIAILLASIAAIYQRYGYAIVSTRDRFSIDPRWINVAPSVAPARGEWREASKDELPLIQSIYRKFAQPRNGYLHRAPVMWDIRVMGAASPGQPDWGPSLLSVYEEDGEPQGYMAYTSKWFEQFQDNAGPGQRLIVRDYAWLTPGAYRSMWDHFKRFDLVNRVVVDCAPADDPAFNILLDPRELNATRFDWLLGRLIDVERALPLRPYGDGRVVFELRDEFCPWNAGRWALESGGGEATCTRSKESPALSLDVSALAQLVFGFASPTQAVRSGRAETTPSADLTMLDSMFRTAYAPFCPDGF